MNKPAKRAKSMSNYCVKLDPTARIQDIVDLENSLKAKVIGQDIALEKIASTLAKQMAGFQRPNRPLATLLFMGSTGVGKTRVPEVLAEIMFNNSKALTKLNLGDYQGEGDIYKILGAAPGYIGYTGNDSKRAISQEKLDKYKTKEWPVSILLLDEIEKAHPSVFKLLLGILDGASLDLNNGSSVDFTKTIIIMTSNIGAAEVDKYMHSGLGFDGCKGSDSAKTRAQITETALRKRFTDIPEFLNRIDESIVFDNLSKESLLAILRIEISNIQGRALCAEGVPPFTMKVTPEAEQYLLEEGTSTRYGARELNRILDRLVISGMSNLVLTGQLEMGDQLVIDMKDKKLIFHKVPHYIIDVEKFNMDMLED